MIKLTHPNHTPIKLQWADQHPQSSYGLGVLIRRNHGIIDGATAKRMIAEGWTIECSTEREAKGVAGALAWTTLGIEPGKIKIVPEVKP